MRDLLEEALGPDFEVIKLAGRGSSAQVFLAREEPLDRLVAVKVLHSFLADDEVAKTRFRREAKAAASLNHPNVASVFRFGFLSNGVPYLVMQYLRGRTLEERVAAEGPLPQDEVRRILRDLARALASAHEQGFVHRDVRPGNVICDLETRRTLLTDFGVAGYLPTGENRGPRITEAGELLGDVKHLSPEQLNGEDATDASDIYALGILGYEILTGGGPYPDLPVTALIAAHLNQPPIPLSSLVENPDPELEALLERCLSKDPSKRPTAVFVAEALAAESSGKPPPVAREVHPQDLSLLHTAMRRKFPQIVVVTAGAGWIALEGVSQLVEVGGNPWYKAAFLTVACGVIASGIVAWFHGAGGKQKVSLTEIFMLGAVGAVWVIGTILLLIAGE